MEPKKIVLSFAEFTGDSDSSQATRKYPKKIMIGSTPFLCLEKVDSCQSAKVYVQVVFFAFGPLGSKAIDSLKSTPLWLAAIKGDQSSLVQGFEDVLFLPESLGIGASGAVFTESGDDEFFVGLNISCFEGMDHPDVKVAVTIRLNPKENGEKTIYEKDDGRPFYSGISYVPELPENYRKDARRHDRVPLHERFVSDPKAVIAQRNICDHRMPDGRWHECDKCRNLCDAGYMEGSDFEFRQDCVYETHEVPHKDSEESKESVDILVESKPIPEAELKSRGLGSAVDSETIRCSECGAQGTNLYPPVCRGDCPAYLLSDIIYTSWHKGIGGHYHSCTRCKEAFLEILRNNVKKAGLKVPQEVSQKRKEIIFNE